MPSSRDSSRRNRVAPVGASILTFSGHLCWLLRSSRQPREKRMSSLTAFQVFISADQLYAQELLARMPVDTPASRFHNRK